MKLLLLVLLLDDYGPVTMLVGTRSRRRTEYVVVSMVVRVRARRWSWSRLLDWMWIGRRDDTDDPLRRCVLVEDRMKNDGCPA